MRVSQTLIAKNLNLSQQAVSKALRGCKTISEKVRRQVEDEAQRLGYRHNKLARSLISGKTGLIGLFLPNFSSPYFLRLFDSIEDALGQNGYQVLAKRWDKRTSNDSADLDVLLQYNVEGILASPRFGTEWEHSIYADIVKRGVKLVGVSGRIDLPGIPAVVPDDYNGAIKAVDFLIEKGHRDIVFIGYKESPGWATVPRRHGYRQGMKMAGLKPRELNYTLDSVDALLGKIKKMIPNELPSVFFCDGDDIAIQLVRFLNENDISVPGDVSVMGYGNNIAYADDMRVPLTTVDQHSEGIGSAAVETLLKQLNEERVGDAEIQAEVIDRGSIKKLAEKGR